MYNSLSLTHTVVFKKVDIYFYLRSMIYFIFSSILDLTLTKAIYEREKAIPTLIGDHCSGNSTQLPKNRTCPDQPIKGLETDWHLGRELLNEAVRFNPTTDIWCLPLVSQTQVGYIKVFKVLQKYFAFILRTMNRNNKRKMHFILFFSRKPSHSLLLW